MPSFGRWEYKLQCMASIAAQDTSFIYLIAPDHGEDMARLEYAVARHAPFAHILPQPATRLHGAINTHLARAYAFKHHHVDAVLHIDDDLILAPNAVSTLLAAYQWAHAQRGICTMQTGVDFRAPLAAKQRLSGAVCYGLVTGTNLLLDHLTFHVTKPFMDEYCKRVSGIAPADYDVPALREWFASVLSRSVPTPGQNRHRYLAHTGGVAGDAALQVALAQAGIESFHLRVNRARCIGEHGVNTSPADFGSLRHVTNDSLPLPSRFHWHRANLSRYPWYPPLTQPITQ